jgi:dihydropteroate synthase
MKPNAWAICNLTPDSFSDGGELDSLSKLVERLERVAPLATIFDFGAESTAPFNAAISSSVELERFKKLLFPLLRERQELFKNHTISIDTYHIDTFITVAQEVRKYLPECSLIWNDVSSFLDAEVVKVVNTFKADYVLCHNLAPERKKCSDHMQYVEQTEDIVEDVVSFLQQRLSKHSIKGTIYLDPCFGFSKSYEQNWHLLKNINTLISQIPEQHWLLGISRKSFLRKKLQTAHMATSNSNLDLLHLSILQQWETQLKGYRWDVRIHTPEILKIALEGDHL